MECILDLFSYLIDFIRIKLVPDAIVAHAITMTLLTSTYLPMVAS